MNIVDLMRRKHWVIVLIIATSSYGIYSGLTSLTEDSINKNWQTKGRTLLIDECINDAGETSTKHS